jgi:hypothetical protein
MKAVFSFWSKPFNRSLHKTFAGFPDQDYFDTAFRLALLTAKKNFESTLLVTDTEGYRLLILDMGLEFDEVSLALDDIADIPANLWMFGKLKAYSIQTGPFVHLDFDMFLLRPVPDWFKTSDVIVQSEEPFKWYEFYRWGVDWVRSTHRNLPREFDAFKNTPFEGQLAHNAGMMGGNHYTALADYGRKAMQLIRDNMDLILNLPDFRQSEANVIYEQYFLSAYARYHNLGIKTYVANILDENEMYRKGFVHLLGDNKGKRDVCEAMAVTYQKMLDGTSEFAY